MSRERKGFLSGLGPVRRGIALAGAGAIMAGSLAALMGSVWLAALRSAPPEKGDVAPVVSLSLPRPLLAPQDDGAALLAAVAALSPDPVIVRVEPSPFALRPVLVPSLSVTVSSKAGSATEPGLPATGLAAQIVAAVPFGGVALGAPDVTGETSVLVNTPGAGDSRPVARPLAVAMRAAPPRPTQRPTEVVAAATALPPAPRSFVATAAVVAAAQAPVVEQLAEIAPPVATAAPAASPQPQSRPARVLLAAARAAAPAAAAPAVQTVALREPVAPPSGALAEALAAAPGAAECGSRLARNIPRRPGSAASGSEFGAMLANVSGTERDQLIAREVLSGNVPQFLRSLTPVSLRGTNTAGTPVTITVCVTPDYVAVGDNDDFLRVPMGLPEAAQIADSFGFMLPTTRIVDAIYAQAAVRLAPRPMQAGPQMTSTSYLSQHNATIEGQGNAAGLRNGVLVAGIKKDLVLTNALRRAPSQVAIYGWHQSNGRPIQPLTTVHGRHYSDYSHGVRLVSQTAYVNGRAVALADLLEDRTYAAMLSNEGTISQPRVLLASLYGR